MQRMKIDATPRGVKKWLGEKMIKINGHAADKEKVGFEHLFWKENVAKD